MTETRSSRTQKLTSTANDDYVFVMNTDRKPFSLGEILELNSLNRNSYNTLVRREGLQFMKRDLLAEGTHYKYRLAHSVALAAFIWSRDTLIPIPGTAEAIDKFWPFLREITERAITDETTQGWIRFQLWDSDDWRAETTNSPGDGLPADQTSWDSLRASLYVPIHMLAREQASQPAAALVA